MGFLATAPRLDQPPRITLPDIAGAAASTDGSLPAFRLLVDGEWREAASGRAFDVRSPIDGSVVATA
ncbi:MAG: hypothetical protein ABIS47_05925, partial [Acidimicrobiales bacterium]